MHVSATYFLTIKRLFFMKIGKINLPIGKDNTSRFNLNNHVIATGEFGQLIPIRQIECVPGDSFDIDVEMFSRTAPLVCPTYGSVKFTTRAYFVPTRLCMAHFKEFITQKAVAVDGGYYNPTIHYITNYELSNLFKTPSNGLATQVNNPSVTNPFDFELRTSTGALNSYYRFTNKGRHWLKVFNGLGIRWNFLLKANGSSVDEANNNNEVRFSLLPLFAFLRVYMDYYLPSQYLIGSSVKQFFDGYIDVTTSHELMIQRLYTVINDIQLTYDDDYFTIAWRYPMSLLDNQPNKNFRMPLESSDLVSYGSDGTSYNPANTQIQADGNRIGVSANDESQDNPVSNWVLSAARSLANYIIRNNYAGSRAVEQILARFGVKVPDYEFQRSVHFGTSETTLQIMDVTNTAESDYAKLGSYGGKAIGYDGGKKMHIECKEYGFIVILATIMPETSMGWQGFERDTQHLRPYDFFTPEFDGKFMQPIFSGELLCDYKGALPGLSDDYQDYIDNNNQPRRVFGFVPTYTEYKTAKDNVIGDFNVPTLKEGLDCYHLFRDYYPDSVTLAQNPDILYFNPEQYNRIFNVTDTSVDHFYMIYRIKVHAERPMKSISQSLPFDDNDIEHRRSVGVQPNGSNFNR